MIGTAHGLSGWFDLAADRIREEQRVSMKTIYRHFAPTGVATGTESYRLELRCVPETSRDRRDQYSCSEFEIRLNDEAPFTIPGLTGLTYEFDPSLSGGDQRGPMWGIPQERFFALTDDRGRSMPFELRYPAYVSLLDFHSINDVFSRPFPFGGGIQDLKEIGAKIEHPASHIEASVHFGTEIRPGSTFVNGSVTLELKGVSMIDGTACAIVAYDAGESRLKFMTPDSEGRESVTEGGSQYKGDMFIDLSTRWLRAATLDEYQIGEITTIGSATKTWQYTVRHISIRLDGH